MTPFGPRRWEKVWLGLLVLDVLLIAGSVLMPHVDGDALFFGEIAKGILRSGDWVTLHHRPSPSWVVDKPPLTFWLMALVLRVTGPTGAALRIWQLPLSLVLLGVTYRLSRLGLAEPARQEEAVLAALLLGTSFLGFYQSVSPQQDVALTVFLALGFVAYLRYRTSGNTGAALLAGVWIAAAVLSKGLVAVAVFGLVVTADMLIPSGKVGYWRWSQVAAGALVFTLVATPWFVVEGLRHGRAFVDALFVSGIGVGRFFHPVLSAPLPYWQAVIAYVPILAIWAFPWTGLLPRAVQEAWRLVGTGPPALRLCALWAGLHFVLLSISPGDKVFRYLFPLFPPLCVLLARVLIRSMNDVRGLRPVVVVTTGVAIPAVGANIWLLLSQSTEVRVFYGPMLVPFLSVVAVSVVVFAALAWRGTARAAVAALCAGALLAYGVLGWAVATHWERLWPWRAVAATVNRLYRPGDRLVFRSGYKPAANPLVYWLDPPIQFADDDATVERLWHQGRVFGVLQPESYFNLRNRLRPTILLEMPTGWVLVTNEAP